MRTTVQLGLALCVGLVACRPGDVAGTDAAPIMLAPGDPVWGLTGAQRNLFGRGRLVFRREFTPETGLGPLFNSTSCAECHEDPLAGGRGDEIEVHATAYDPAGDVCDDLAGQGGPVIQQQATPALQAALGITQAAIPPGVDPVGDPEIDQATLDQADAFVRFLAAPSPLRGGDNERHGSDLFSQIGCASCHVPTLRTGPSPIAALSNKQFAAYSDVLLHDMGPELEDICLGLATPAEFRTQPPISLRVATHFLHDGRATTLDQALAQHGGEAAGARDRFKALSPADSAALIMFLKSL